jgi:hypothetical protein
VEQATNLKTSIDVLNSSVASGRSLLVRTAKESDLDFLASEALKFSKFYGTKFQLFPGEELAKKGFESLMTKHLVLISEDNGVPTGFIAGYYLPHPFNPNLILLAESFWWVKEEFRAGRSALKLLNAFVDFGKKHANWITFSLEHHSPVKESCLLKRGFRFQEKSYLLEVE